MAAAQLPRHVSPSAPVGRRAAVREVARRLSDAFVFPRRPTPAAAPRIAAAPLTSRFSGTRQLRGCGPISTRSPAGRHPDRCAHGHATLEGRSGGHELGGGPAVADLVIGTPEDIERIERPRSHDCLVISRETGSVDQLLQVLVHLVVDSRSSVCARRRLMLDPSIPVRGDRRRSGGTSSAGAWWRTVGLPSSSRCPYRSSGLPLAARWWSALD